MYEAMTDWLDNLYALIFFVLFLGGLVLGASFWLWQSSSHLARRRRAASVRRRFPALWEAGQEDYLQLKARSKLTDRPRVAIALAKRFDEPLSDRDVEDFLIAPPKGDTSHLDQMGETELKLYYMLLGGFSDDEVSEFFSDGLKHAVDVSRSKLTLPEEKVEALVRSVSFIDAYSHDPDRSTS